MPDAENIHYKLFYSTDNERQKYIRVISNHELEQLVYFYDQYKCTSKKGKSLRAAITSEFALRRRN